MKEIPQEETSHEATASGFLAELRGGGGGAAAAEGDESGGIADFTSVKPRRRVSLSNIVIALVLTVSAGSLYLMRQQGKGAGMTFQVTKIDYELDKAGKSDPNHARILAELMRTGTALQIQADKIQKNPFQIETGAPPPIPTATLDPDAERRRRTEQERLEMERRERDIATRFAGAELNGVMGGTIPLARINGLTVRVGDTVSEVFTVTEIHADERSVVLTADGVNYTLRMGESSGGPRRPTSAPRR